MKPERTVCPKRRKPRTLLLQACLESIAGVQTNARGGAALSSLEWHVMSLEEVFSRLSTPVNQGLSLEEVKFRLVEYWRNTPLPCSTNRFKTCGYLYKGFGSIPLVGSMLHFICWKPLGDPPTRANLVLAIVLLAIFFIQAAFNAWQDWSSSKLMASIQKIMPEVCLLLRDGAQVITAASGVVPGDLLLIRAGNMLPADARFVELSPDARFDRSILNGS